MESDGHLIPVMKTKRVTRRQFFKLSAFGAGTTMAASFIGVAAPAPSVAQAAADEPRLNLPQPTFNAIASALPAGGPPVDIAMGWDGTLWAIDAEGAPHLYDPTQNAWLAHGEGVDAAASLGGITHVFRGSQVLQIDESSGAATLTTIAQAFPNLSDSFKLGVGGAAVVDNKLIVFKGGRYMPADGSLPPRKLTDLAIWPRTAPWQDGLITGMYYDSTGVYFLNGGAYFGIYNLFGFNVGIGPGPVSQFYNWARVLPPSWVSTGIDAGMPTPSGFVLFKGTRVAQFGEFANDPVTPAYLPAVYTNWPMTWNPALNHAPSGRVGNLWAATRSGGAVQHDGEDWVVRDGAGNSVSSVSSGSDSSTFLCGSGSNTLWQWTGATWDPVANHSTGLAQVAAGSIDHVWVRDASNTPHRFASGALTAVNLGAGIPSPTHMVANDDGSIWHCNSGYADVFRLVSESTAASAALPLKAGITTSVQKVASTGFGTAHCLAAHSDGSMQVYRYDSPYVFKTSKPYVLWGAAPMAQGLGQLYFVQLVSYPNSGTLNVRFVALDAHTGAEIASHTPPGTSTQYTGMVFDPIHDLVYVGASPLNDDNDNTTPGQVIALDARAMTVKWTVQTKAGVDGAPALSGTQLCFGDRTNTLYMFDTGAALASAAAPRPVWTWVVPTRSATTHRVTTPVIANNKVYAAAWDLDTIAIGGNEVGHYHYLAQCDAATGLNGGVSIGDFIPDNASKPLIPQNITTSPALGRVRGTDGSDVSVALVNDGFSVYVHSLTQGKAPVATAFSLPTGRISTGFAWDDGTRLGAGLSSAGPSISDVRLWFGDDAGNLWSLNSALQPVDNTPSNLGANAAIFTTPVLYKDPQGGLTVLFGASQSGLIPLAQPPSLYGYDPRAGQRAAIPTGVTQIWNLAQGVTNGVVYAAGGGTSTPDGQVSQVFGIRVDELPQALRDFIIESQMMQDPDPSAPGGDARDPTNPVPPSRARYQTHLTIVDDGKHPIIHEAIKIWAEQPMTIQVDGVAYDIGPGDAQYAALKTGSDGSLVITSGYTRADGSDTPDMYAPALRVWASFMDPYERVVVNPDHEFHQRAATAHSNASDDDPNKVNLVTCKSYAGRGGSKPAALFTNDEVSAGQPANCANAIGQMRSGVGFGGGGATNATATLFCRLMLFAGGKRQAQRAIGSTALAASAAAGSPPKYVAYGDLTGSGYFPTNIPAARPTAVTQTTGLAFTKPQGQPATKATFSAMYHTDAAAAIDALPPPTPNPPWVRTPLAGGERLGVEVFVPQRASNIFSDFWNWLKGVTAEITHIIVSIADEVAVGIRLIVNGVEQVFKAIVKVVDDIASAIGSFFRMIEKFIEDVVAALSVLFHFGEIMWTHRWMAQQFSQRVGMLAADIKTHVIPAVDGFVRQGEGAIADYFNKLRADLGPNDGINNLKGSGATPHTMCSIGPGGGSGASQAAQCNWGTQKLKSGMPSVTPASSKAAAGDPLSDFFTAFVSRLTGDGDLSAVLGQLQSDFGKLFMANSAQQFFSTLLVTLLDLLEAVLVGALAIAGAFVDGMLALIDDVIQAVLAALNAEIQIPVLTWLYESLFGEPMTILNMLTLVAAIPVTIIYRVAEGVYPSQALRSIAGTGDMQPTNAQAASPTIQRVLGVVNSWNNFMLGLLAGIGDLRGANAPAGLDKTVVGVGLLVTVLSVPAIGSDDPSTEDWVVFGLTAAWALAGVFALEGFNLADQAALPWCTMAIGVLILAAVIVQFVDNGSRDVTANAGLANGIATAVVAVANPIKLAKPPIPGPVIVCAIDIASGVVVAVTDLIQAFAVQAPAPSRFRLYFPFVPVDSRAAHSVAG